MCVRVLTNKEVSFYLQMRTIQLGFVALNEYSSQDVVKYIQRKCLFLWDAFNVQKRSIEAWLNVLSCLVPNSFLSFSATHCCGV